MTEPTASTTPKPSASPGAMRPAGNGRSAVRRISASMSRSYHMLMAPAAPAADRDAQHRDRGQHRMEMAGREHKPDEAGEDDQRHHPRLQQRDIVADAARRQAVSRRGSGRAGCAQSRHGAAAPQCGPLGAAMTGSSS